MRIHKFLPGNPTGKVSINFVAKDINTKGVYKVDKNIPRKYKNLAFQVVICKLRSETTERHRQHWRAAKALLVIFPLLGISYIITLVGPTDTHRVFQYVRALLLSLQVSVIVFCYINLSNLL